jgi:hypothetical protein
MALIKDVDSITRDRKLKVRKRGEKFDHTSLLPDDEWYPKAVRPKIRPARWNWLDCHAKLQEMRALRSQARIGASSFSSTTTLTRWRARHRVR